MQGKGGGRHGGWRAADRFIPDNAILGPFFLRAAPWDDKAVHDLFDCTACEMRTYYRPEPGQALPLPTAVQEQAQNISLKVVQANLSLFTRSSTSTNKWNDDRELHSEADEVLLACRRMCEVAAREVLQRLGQRPGSMQLSDMINIIRREARGNLPMLKLVESLDTSRKWTNRGAHGSNPDDLQPLEFIENNMAVACRYAVALLPQLIQVVQQGQGGANGSGRPSSTPRSRPSTPPYVPSPQEQRTPSRGRSNTPPGLPNTTPVQVRPEQRASVKVRNLPRQLTNERLFAIFQATVGCVVSVEVPNGHNHGFVNFISHNDARRAVSMMDQKDLHGTVVGVELQASRPSAPLGRPPSPGGSWQRPPSPAPNPRPQPSPPPGPFQFPSPPPILDPRPIPAPRPVSPEPFSRHPRTDTPVPSPAPMWPQQRSPNPIRPIPIVTPPGPAPSTVPVSMPVPVRVPVPSPAPAPVDPQPRPHAPLRPYPVIPPAPPPVEPISPAGNGQPPAPEPILSLCAPSQAAERDYLSTRGGASAIGGAFNESIPRPMAHNIPPAPDPAATERQPHQPGITDSGIYRLHRGPPIVPSMVGEEEPDQPEQQPDAQEPNLLEQQPGEAWEEYMLRLTDMYNRPSPGSSRLQPGPAPAPAPSNGGGGGKPAGQAAVPTTNPGATTLPTPAPAAPTPTPAVQAQPGAPVAPPLTPPSCIICWSEPIDHGFLHGGSIHNCACRDCAYAIGEGGKCPMCRQDVEQVLRIFTPTPDGDEPQPTPRPSTSNRPAPLPRPTPSRAALTLRGHSSQVNSLVFNPQGNLLASASDDRSVRIWSVDYQGAQKAVLSHCARVRDVAFSPDGTLCITASEDTKLRVWDMASFQPTGIVFTGHDSCPNSVAVANHRGSAVCVSGANAGSIMVWDLQTGQTRGTLVGHTSHVHSVAISADGNTVVSSGLDKMIRVWDLATCTPRRTLAGHTGTPCNIYGVACSPAPASTICVSVGMDKTVRVWDFESGQPLHVFAGVHTDWVRAVAISADGTRCFSAGGDKTLRVWDLVDYRLRETKNDLHARMIYAVAVARTGTVATASADKTIRMW